MAVDTDVRPGQGDDGEQHEQPADGVGHVEPSERRARDQPPENTGAERRQALHRHIVREWAPEATFVHRPGRTFGWLRT